jgi:hypothetical protein
MEVTVPETGARSTVSSTALCADPTLVWATSTAAPADARSAGVGDEFVAVEPLAALVDCEEPVPDCTWASLAFAESRLAWASVKLAFSPAGSTCAKGWPLATFSPFFT